MSAIQDIAQPLSSVTTRHAPAQNGAVGLLRTAIARFWHHVQYRRTIAELSDLDDRTLADIGLRRSEIPNVAAAAWFNDDNRRPVVRDRDAYGAGRSASRFAA